MVQVVVDYVTAIVYLKQVKYPLKLNYMPKKAIQYAGGFYESIA
jgi:hypothetical protein